MRRKLAQGELILLILLYVETLCSNNTKIVFPKHPVGKVIDMRTRII
jgi:hypothetical protein